MADQVVRWIASNEPLAAAVVAGAVAVLLYGVLGRRFLGADDDFWTPLRRQALPVLDDLGRNHGLYAESERNSWRELVGTAYVDDLDTFERHLEAMGYLRNPLAAYKYAPVGWKSDGSWARRFGYIDGTGRYLKALGAASRVPLAGFLGGAVGRLLIGLSDILALRQRHVFLFARPAADDAPGDVAVHVFVHDEPNSLNPLTAWAHYRGGVDGEPGGDWDVDAGVSGFLADIERYDGQFPFQPVGDEQGAPDGV